MKYWPSLSSFLAQVWDSYKTAHQVKGSAGVTTLYCKVTSADSIRDCRVPASSLQEARPPGVSTRRSHPRFRSQKWPTVSTTWRAFCVSTCIFSQTELMHPPFNTSRISVIFIMLCLNCSPAKRRNNTRSTDPSGCSNRNET